MKEISVEQLMTEVVRAIRIKYKSVKNFAENHSKEANLDMYSADLLRCYLTKGTTMKNVYVMERLYEHLGLGELKHQTTRTVKTTYYVEDAKQVV